MSDHNKANEQKSLPWVHPGNWADQYGGLTKRELFAAMAMQGILSTETTEDDFGAKDVSRRAVAFADALLSALQQVKP